MAEKIVQGRTQEEIIEKWALELNLPPEDITLEVLEKPGLISRKWKVRLIWKDQSQVSLAIPSQVVWDGSIYVIAIGEGVKQLRPSIEAGEIWYKGELQAKTFRINLGDQVEFHPLVQKEQLTWELKVLPYGLSVVAKVRHDLPGHYILPPEIPSVEEIDLEQYITWESISSKGEVWDQARLKSDLEQLNVVFGFKNRAWSEILAVKGVAEIVIAEATLPVQSRNAQLEDYVGVPQEFVGGEVLKIDFFASKVILVEEGAVLARKIPGLPGIPGKNVLGIDIPVAPFKDFQFRLKKNVRLSDSGLEVLAGCAGQPVRLDEKTYMVESVYVVHKDVDLSTGSIEFPGDVFVDGNVQDGLHIFAGGKLEIKGSVSRAEIRAEKGAKILQNLIGGKVVIGEKFVVRSELLRNVSQLQDELSVCLRSTKELIESSGAGNLKPGQCLKLILEKRFPELPKLSNRVENFVLEHQDDEIVSESLIVSIRTAKHFLAGLGPLDLQSLPFLQRVSQALEQFIRNLSLEIPEKLLLMVSYVQGATIECGGSFECQKGVYNSEIHVEGDVKIDGVCRGGKLFSEGTVMIRELGGSGVSTTFAQINPNKHLLVDFCHPNVIVAVGKEIVHIEEACKKLEIYREKGRVQVEKIRATPL